MSFLDWITKKVEEPPVPKDFDFENNTTQQKDYAFASVYNYVIFANYVDIEIIIGRTGYGYDAEMSAKYEYIRNIWCLSKELISRDTISPKIFFNKVDELEELLYYMPFSDIKNYNKDFEIEEYERRKEQVVIDFLNRSFTDRFQHALELKTVKGRITNIENWFTQMEYYKRFMNEKEIFIIDSLFVHWSSELKQIAEKS